MKIGDLARQSGIPASTIRFWERAGVLPAPVRVSGQRRYSKDAVYLLSLLRLAQACGFTLSEMRRLVNGFEPGFKASRRWRELTKNKISEIDALIEQLRTMRRLIDLARECKCENLTACGRTASKVMQEAAQ